MPEKEEAQVWVEKYRPRKFSEVKGQEIVIERLKKFMNDFKRGKKALVLHGSPGTGKTTLAHVIANELDSEILELNASDLRNKEKLREILKPAIEQKSLRKDSKVILIDEVDGISAVDRGGLSELVSLITYSTNYPIILTANDVWDKSLSPLRQKAELVQLKEIEYLIIKEVLIEILKKEGVSLNGDLITSLSVRARGDLRAAINDLQAISKMEEPSLALLYERDKEIDIFNALKLVFKGKPSKDTLSVYDAVDMSIDEIILWVEENIPSEFRGEELFNAVNILSKVDVFKGRIYKQQYWRFLVYENFLLSYGISSAKKVYGLKGKGEFTKYKKPTRILKIWMNNQKTVYKKSITQKYAEHVHIGSKRAMMEFPILSQIIKSDPEIQKELKLTDEEIGYLLEKS